MHLVSAFLRPGQSAPQRLIGARITRGLDSSLSLIGRGLNFRDLMSAPAPSTACVKR